MEVLNFFDTIILIIILISCLVAFFKGFVVSFLSLGNWLISLILTYISFPHVSEFLSNHIDVKAIVITISSVGVFFTFSLIFGVINFKLANMLRNHIDGMIDRVLGVTFGLVRGLVICSVIFFVINVISKELQIGDDPERAGPKFFVNARLYDTLRASTDLLIGYLPFDITEDSERALSDIKQSTRDRLNYISQKEIGQKKSNNNDANNIINNIGNSTGNSTGNNNDKLMQLFEENINNIKNDINNNQKVK